MSTKDFWNKDIKDNLLKFNNFEDFDNEFTVEKIKNIVE